MQYQRFGVIIVLTVCLFVCLFDILAVSELADSKQFECEQKHCGYNGAQTYLDPMIKLDSSFTLCVSRRRLRQNGLEELAKARTFEKVGILQTIAQEPINTLRIGHNRVFFQFVKMFLFSHVFSHALWNDIL